MGTCLSMGCVYRVFGRTASNASNNASAASPEGPRLAMWVASWVVRWVVRWVISWVTGWVTYFVTDWFTSWVTSWFRGASRGLGKTSCPDLRPNLQQTSQPTCQVLYWKNLAPENTGRTEAQKPFLGGFSWLCCRVLVPLVVPLAVILAGSFCILLVIASKVRRRAGAVGRSVL